MYRRLGHAEDFGGGADGGAVLNDVTGQSTGPLLDISLQDPTRSLSRYGPCICAPPGEHAEKAAGMAESGQLSLPSSPGERLKQPSGKNGPPAE